MLEIAATIVVRQYNDRCHLSERKRPSKARWTKMRDRDSNAIPDWVKASRCHPRAARVQANPRCICDDVAPVPNARNWRLPIGLCAAALAIVGGTVQAPTAAAGSMTSTSADTRHLEVLASKSGFGLVRARVYKSTKPRTVFYVRGYGRNLRVLTEIRCDVISRGDGGLSVTAPWHPLARWKVPATRSTPSASSEQRTDVQGHRLCQGRRDGAAADPEPRTLTSQTILPRAIHPPKTDSEFR